MLKSDLIKFSEIMKALDETYTSEQPLTPVKIELYFQVLNGYDIKAIQEGVSRMMKKRVYTTFPVPAEIISYIPKADEKTLVEIRAGIEDWLYNNGPQPTDPISQRVIKSYGGWERLGMTSFNDLKFLLRDLEERADVAQRKNISLLPGAQEHLMLE